MALGVLWFFGTVAGGFIYLVGSPLAHVLSVAELAAAAVPVGAIFSAWAVYLVASLSSNLSPGTIVLAQLLLLAAVGAKAPRFWRNWRALLERGAGADAPDVVLSAVLAAVLGAVFWPLYRSRMIPEHDGKIWSGGSCWADLPIHMHIAEAFLQGRNTDISWGAVSSPVFAGEKMYYPFLPDFHAAVMKRLGGGLADAFHYSGWALATALWVLLYSLAVRVTRSRLGGLLAVALTIGAGGMGGPSYVWNKGWAEALNVDTAQNDVTGGYKIFWFAFIPHVLLPQRGANFAYPMAVLVLLLVWRATDMALRLPMADRRSLLVHAAGFAAALPLVQAHSFIGLGMMIGTYFLLDAHKWLAHPALAAAWAQAGVVAVAVGYPQMAFFKKQVEKGAGGKFITLGWIFADNAYGRDPGGLAGFARFWWTSLGPAVPLFFGALAVIGWDVASAGWHARALAAKGSALPDALGRYGTGLAASTAVPLLPDGDRRRHRGNADSDDDYDDDGGEGDAAAAAGGGDDGDDDGGSGLALPHVGNGHPHARARRRPRTAQVVVTTLSTHLDRLRTELRRAVTAAEESAVISASAAAKRAGGGAGAAVSEPSPVAVGIHAVANLPPVLASAFVKAAYANWRPGRGTRLLYALYGHDGAPAEEPTTIGTHFLGAVLDYAPDAVADVISGRGSLAITGPDRLLAPLNALSLTGRALDAGKLAAAAGVVWLVGNYVNFQPWDRDNCKLFYLWVFTYAGLIGALLAAPLEFLLGLPSGYARLMALVGAPYAEVLALARSGDARLLVPPAQRAREAAGAGGGAGSSWAAGVRDAGAAAWAAASARPRKEKVEDDDDEGAGGYRVSTSVTGGGAGGGTPLAATSYSVAYGGGGDSGSGSSDDHEARISAPFRRRRVGARVLAAPLAVASLATLALSTLTGVLMVVREYGMNHVMFDEDAIAVGKFLSERAPPSGVVVHRDHHIFASGSLAGRPTLLAYTGWMSSHGYNFFERDKDRNHILANVLSDRDSRTRDLLYKWGVRYVLGEWLPIHFRPSQAAHEEAEIAYRTAATDEERAAVERVPFDPDLFLEGTVRRVFKAGRFDVLEVLGYGSYNW